MNNYRKTNQSANRYEGGYTKAYDRGSPRYEEDKAPARANRYEGGYTKAYVRGSSRYEADKEPPRNYTPPRNYRSSDEGQNNNQNHFLSKMMERMQEQLSNQLQKEIRRQFHKLQSQHIQDNTDYNIEYPSLQEPMNPMWNQPQW